MLCTCLLQDRPFQVFRGRGGGKAQSGEKREGEEEKEEEFEEEEEKSVLGRETMG